MTSVTLYYLEAASRGGDSLHIHSVGLTEDAIVADAMVYIDDLTDEQLAAHDLSPCQASRLDMRFDSVPLALAKAIVYGVRSTPTFTAVKSYIAGTAVRDEPPAMRSDAPCQEAIEKYFRERKKSLKKKGDR
jgi:hypothetical protein